MFAASLLEKSELTLLGLVAGGDKMLEGLLSALGGLAAHDTTMLVVLKVLAGQTTAGVVSRSVHNLSAGTDSTHLTTGHRDSGRGAGCGLHGGHHRGSLGGGHILTTTHSTSIATSATSSTSRHFLSRSAKITHRSLQRQPLPPLPV
jgi:hypothetical protein